MAKVKHDLVIEDGKDSSINSFDSRHRIRINLHVTSDACVIVLSRAEHSIMLVLLNLVQSDYRIASLAFQTLCEDSVFIIVAEYVHQNVWLC